RYSRYECELDGAFAASEQPPLPAPGVLSLKKGAQVMFVKNDPERRWVNGTMGHVRRLLKKRIEVTVDGEIVDVEPVEWEMLRYTFDRKLGRIETETIGTFVQFPLKVAYAITV